MHLVRLSVKALGFLHRSPKTQLRLGVDTSVWRLRRSTMKNDGLLSIAWAQDQSCTQQGAAVTLCSFASEMVLRTNHGKYSARKIDCEACTTPMHPLHVLHTATSRTYFVKNGLSPGGIEMLHVQSSPDPTSDLRSMVVSHGVLYLRRQGRQSGRRPLKRVYAAGRLQARKNLGGGGWLS